MSPVDAMEEAVRLSAGLIDYYRHELAAAAAKIGGPDEAAGREAIGLLRGPYMEAIKLEKDVSAAALGSKVAERRQVLAERQAAFFAQAITGGLARAFGDLATSARRTVFAEEVERILLAVGEAEDVPLGAPRLPVVDVG